MTTASSALGVTGVGESGVLLDRDGQPAVPIIAWYDPRGDVELIAKDLPDLAARTGVPFNPIATIFKLPGLLRRGAGRGGSTSPSGWSTRSEAISKRR